MTALLPCPFCGSSAMMDFAGKGAACGNPKCFAAQVVTSPALWNRRAMSGRPNMSDPMRDEIRARAAKFRAQGMNIAKGHEADRMWAIDIANMLDGLLACHPEAAGITHAAVSRLLEEAEAIEAPLERWGYVRSRLERWSKGG